MKRRVVVGISGASGAAIGVRVVELLGECPDYAIHLVITAGGERTLRHEVGPGTLARVDRLASERHPISDIGATIASGSFQTAGMIVAPCSMRSLSTIAAGASDNLLTRAADVHLKERRRLVLITRETPLHLGHLRAMTAATECGAIIAPPVPAFYLRPQSIDAVIDQLARRAITLLGIEIAGATEWRGLADSSAAAARAPSASSDHDK